MCGGKALDCIGNERQIVANMTQRIRRKPRDPGAKVELDKTPPVAGAGNSNAAAGRKTDENDPPVCTDVEELPDNLHRLVDRMLKEGASYEDTVNAVNAAGQAQILLGAVEAYFRSNLQLQQNRVFNMVDVMGDLKQCLKDPNSAQAKFAEAVLMTGLMGLRRDIAGGNVQQAVRAKEQHENYRLREKSLRLKTKKITIELEMMKARLDAERTKLILVKAKLEQIQRVLEREAAGNTLSPEMIERIQEVYGIVSSETAVKPDGQEWQN
jgi:hypothetical protein